MATYRPSVVIPTTANGVTTYQLGELPIGSTLEQDVLPVVQISYENRSTLKSGSSTTGDIAFVESLGLFRFYQGSTETDDDETCFTQSGGAWLLECPHWDFIDANMRFDFDEINSRFLSAISPNTITLVNSISSDFQQVTLTGAVIGDNVLVTPTSILDSRLNFYAYVESTDVVKVVVNNTSSTDITMGGDNTWNILVIKS